MPDTDRDTETLTDIQTTLSFQDQKLDDLNEMVTQQWAEIEKLRRYVTRLEGKIEKLEDDSGSSDDGKALSVSEQAARDKPPHY